MILLLIKVRMIKRCIRRINEVYDDDFHNLENLTKQDSIILNIIRLIEACLYIANHILRKKKLGVPQSSKNSFQILENNKIIPQELSLRLQGMVGFRNIAVHDYQSLNISIVQKITENYIYDGITLCNEIINFDKY